MAFSFRETGRKKGGELVIQFQHFVKDQELVLDSVTYRNSLDQPFQITAFKYYVSNIHLVKADGKTVSIPGYFLVNEEELESRKIQLSNLQEGPYSSVEFLVGVDSARNCSGIQKDALDPTKGMFWAWNTGYIFLKLDGISPLSTAPGHKLEYHMGGFKQPNNHLRTIRLETPDLQIQSKKTTTFEIKTDAAALLSSTHKINFTTVPMVVDADKAADLADNVLHLFSVTRIQNGL
jgi:hypothetical protein